MLKTNESIRWSILDVGSMGFQWWKRTWIHKVVSSLLSFHEFSILTMTPNQCGGQFFTFVPLRINIEKITQINEVVTSLLWFHRFSIWKKKMGVIRGNRFLIGHTRIHILLVPRNGTARTGRFPAQNLDIIFCSSLNRDVGLICCLQCHDGNLELTKGKTALAKRLRAMHALRQVVSPFCDWSTAYCKWSFRFH